MNAYNSIENLYCYLDNHIKLTYSYTEIKELPFLIKTLRLKPQAFMKKFSKKLKLHKWWIDEYGNSLLITEHKDIQLVLNDLKIDRSLLTSSDLYEYLSLEKVSKISKLAYIFYGKEEDFETDHLIISFLGIDEYLRTYVYLYGEWKNYPSIYLGMDILYSIAKKINIVNYHELFINHNTLYPCTKRNACISYWPPTEDFLSFIKEQNEFAYNVLKCIEPKDK